jgi:multidrug resistance efflux pump
MSTEDAPQEKVVKKKKSKFIIILLTLALAGGAAGGIYFVWQRAGYLMTDNARVTTTLIAITSDTPGVLERLTVSEGFYVKENEILGWVKNGRTLRSPVDGLVIYTGAVQGQMVSPQEMIAVIADTSKIHIQANIEETDILGLQKGQRAIVTIDTFGNRPFEGYISEIGRITTAELSGQAVFFNTGGTFTRVTHLIPIEINLTDYINLESLIGVNARVQIPIRGE